LPDKSKNLYRTCEIQGTSESVFINVKFPSTGNKKIFAESVAIRNGYDCKYINSNSHVIFYRVFFKYCLEKMKASSSYNDMDYFDYDNFNRYYDSIVENKFFEMYGTFKEYNCFLFTHFPHSLLEYSCGYDGIICCIDAESVHKFELENSDVLHNPVLDDINKFLSNKKKYCLVLVYLPHLINNTGKVIVERKSLLIENYKL
jgi:hypothetical protein